MSGVGAYRQSLACRWVNESAVARFFATPPPMPEDTLAHSAVVRTLRAVPGLRGVVAVAILFSGLAAVFLGNVPLAIWCLVLLASLFAPVLALSATPALLIWAPKLAVAHAGDELLFLRLDQAAIAGMVMACVLDRERSLRTPPAHTAWLLFLGVVVASAIVGSLQGTLETPTSSVLYLAQWLTWYALFVAAYNLAPRLDHNMMYAWVLPLVALAAYGIAEHCWPYDEDPGIRYRTFERGLFPGQANHAGGLLALAVVSGLALACSSRHRVAGIALAVLAAAALLPTGSRSGLVAWAAGITVLAMIYIPALRWWIPPLSVVGLFAVPAGVWYRVSAPGSSMYDRLVAWKSALSTVVDYPLLGLGAGARHRSFYDSQYFMTLAESGLVGLLVWAVFIACLARALVQARATAWPHPWMATSALAGLGVLLVHSLATASFIVTLVAGPFFWYCAVTLGRSTESS